MFEAINSGNYFWYVIKRWRHREKSRSNLQVGEHNAWVLSLFCETAGIHCACNALYGLCWTQIKQIFHWVRRNLDHISVEGDNLYKSLHTSGMVSVDQLPAL